MFPTLLNLGFIQLRTYGACMAIGFLVCWKLIEVFGRRKDLSNLLVSLMVSGVVGSRIAYVIEHWQTEFAANPAAIIRVDQGGLMFYGGLILSILVFFGWCLFNRQHPLAIADLLALVIPLGHAFGRVGCFFYGCCYGRLSNSSLAVTFPRHSPAWYEQLNEGLITSSARVSLPVLPTQLFEAAVLLVLFAALVAFWHCKWRRPGMILGAYLVGYAVIRFGLECLRGDPRAQVGVLSISQTISLVMIALGLAFAFYDIILGKRTRG